LQVKEWVQERGGRLMYLGGNGVNCEVTLHDDHGEKTVLWSPTVLNDMYSDDCFTKTGLGQAYSTVF
jgi:hypothetical protein